MGPTWSEAHVASVIAIVNERLGRTLTTQEKGDSNMVYIFNTIYRLFAVGTRAPLFHLLYCVLTFNI